jgi:hypothetical protein
MVVVMVEKMEKLWVVSMVVMKVVWKEKSLVDSLAA